MTVRNLAETPFEVLISCFLKSFENYFVNMPSDIEYYRMRWSMANVDYKLSYGMFDGDELVGFILHAIDKLDGSLIAFNAATGVLPVYRGRKVVNLIYDHALLELKKYNIEYSVLEVITENLRAIHVYKSVGFEIQRTYKCFNGSIRNFEHKPNVQIIEVDLQVVDWTQLPNQQLYSWENQKRTIQNGASFKFCNVYHDQEWESFFIINPDNGYISQFDILNANEEAWDRLFYAISKTSSTIKINNVDTLLQDKINALIRNGLVNTIDQYEMKLKLT